MALELVTIEILNEIARALGKETLNRPHAAWIDPGDFGTVFSYIPIFKDEFAKLPVNLQKYVYVLGKDRFGLVAFVPKDFSTPTKGNILEITEVYNEYGTLKEMTYTLDEGRQVFRVENPLRREMLQNYAKKKKIPVKKIIRS